MDWLSRFWSHSVVQISTWLVSILLGAYLGYLAAGWAEKTRELIYYVNPARAVIVKAGEGSTLEVYHGGRPVTTDVSAVQVQVWNQGREAIRQTQMLQPLVLRTADQAPILEATVRQQTRPEIVRLHLDDAKKSQGRIGVSWEILEQGDGGIIQLVIAGKPDIPVKAEAVIEGQRHVREVAATNHKSTGIPWLGLGLSLTMLNVFNVIGMSKGMRTTGRRPAKAIALPLGGLAVGVGLIGWGLYVVLSGWPSTPPLPF